MRPPSMGVDFPASVGGYQLSQIAAILLTMITISKPSSSSTSPQPSTLWKLPYSDRISSVNSTILELHNIGVVDGGSMEVIDEPCPAALHRFASLAANLLGCAVSLAHPLVFCEGCVEQYVLFLDSYEFISKNTKPAKDGKTCVEDLLRSDRIELVSQTYIFLSSMWERSNCDACFISHGMKNGKVHYELTNETERFMEKFNLTRHCMDNPCAHSPAASSHCPMNLSDPVCHYCRTVYRNLTKYYTNLQDGDDSRVCMDIVDAMNYTRQRWSAEFSCVTAHRQPLAVALATGFMVLLVPIFYFASKLRGARPDLVLRPQQRLDMSVSAALDDSVALRSSVRRFT